MTTAFVFDLDDTLTLPRQRIVFRIAQVIQIWSGHNDFYLLTGSDFPKVKDQLFYLTKLFKGCYVCGGNEFWTNDELVESYADILDVPSAMSDWFIEKLQATRYPNQLMGQHIESRSGMINFSIVGRGEKKYAGNVELDTGSRIEYSKWDKKYNERKMLVGNFNRNFSDNYYAEVAGETGIDIFKHGTGKDQVFRKLEKQYDQIFFFAAGTEKGGNNYSFAVQCQSPHRVYTIEKPTDIIEHMSAIRTEHGTIRIS